MGVRSEQHGAVRLVVIDRPGRANAIDMDTAVQLSAIFDGIEGDELTRAVVLTGAGDRVFSAGMDLAAVAAGEAAAINALPGGFAGLVRRSLPQPVVAAVNGAAMGGGFEIVLACDLVVAADHARFALPEVTKGLFPASGGALRLSTRIPAALAMEHLLLGAPINAERALQLGLVNRVVPAGQELQQAIDMASQLAAFDPAAVRAATRVARAALSASLPQLWPLNDEVAAALVAGTDTHQESGDARTTAQVGE